MINTTTFGIYG